MKKTKHLILVALIICTLFTFTFADVGDWNSYDSYDSYDYSSNDDYDYSWDDDDDYSYRNNNDDDYKSTPKITDESYEYDETWDEATVIPVDGYSEIDYRHTTPNYYFYYLSTFKPPKQGGYFVPKGTIEKTVRIKKTALSYDYDVIYDKEDSIHTINNPLNKEIKSEDFYLTPDYEKVLHEEICPGNTSTDQMNSYKLNDYFYYKKLDESGKEIGYKVYKDLIKIDSIKYDGFVLYEKDYTYFISSSELDKSDEYREYYINKSTGEIVHVGEWNIVVEEGTEGIFPIIAIFTVIGLLIAIPFNIFIVIVIVKFIISCIKERRESVTEEQKQKNLKFWTLAFSITILWCLVEVGDGYKPEFLDIIAVICRLLFVALILYGVKAMFKPVTEKNMAKKEVAEKKQELALIDQLEQTDPNFNKDEFMQWVDSVFMELQTAWTNKDVDKLKTLEDNALYSTHRAQLERYIKDKKTNYIERIAIREKEINGYKEDDGFEFIDLTLWVEMVDYIKDDVTGNVIKGRTEDRLMMEYNIVFKRKKGVKTYTVGELETVNCPSCGAPIDISASAVCEYCNNVVNTSNHSWVISRYKGRNVYR